MAESNEKTGAFDVGTLNQGKCPDCSGTGELRIDSEYGKGSRFSARFPRARVKTGGPVLRS